MATLHLLGTGAALSDASRTTTMLAIEGGSGVYLIDCGGDAAHRALASGIDLRRVEGLIVTHEHADHAGGFPLLMERLWLAGRTEPFPVYGIAEALAQVARLEAAFDTSSWPNYPAIVHNEIRAEERAPVFENDDFTVIASPAEHSVPSVALRVEAASGLVTTYSCDTAPSAAVTRLARGSQLLVHEATGKGFGHSNSAEAAQVALDAGVEQLVLVHIGPQTDGGAALLRAATDLFPSTELGRDGGSYQI